MSVMRPILVWCVLNLHVKQSGKRTDQIGSHHRFVGPMFLKIRHQIKSDLRNLHFGALIRFSERGLEAFTMRFRGP